jgi:hypothetical protein
MKWQHNGRYYMKWQHNGRYYKKWQHNGCHYKNKTMYREAESDLSKQAKRATCGLGGGLTRQPP